MAQNHGITLTKLVESGLSIREYLKEIEVELTREALQLTRNNKNKAAKLLGLQRTALVMRLKVLNEKDTRKQ